jgi:uncharacterized protein YidB (DUF937 family)
MSLLNSIIGAAAGSLMGGQQQQQQAANPMLNIVLGLLANKMGGGAGAGGALGALGGMLGGGATSGAGGALGALSGLLGSGGAASGAGGALGALGGLLGGAGGGNAIGGLAGLMGQFQQAGHGHVMDSWIGKGENIAVSGEQLQQVFGGEQISSIASQLGISEGEASNQLAGILPQIIDQLTPGGQAPEGGFGDANQLMGLLGGLMKQ